MSYSGDLIMFTPNNPFTLIEWQRSITQLYALIRGMAVNNQKEAWMAYCTMRNALFKDHLNSPLNPEQKTTFKELSYYPYNPAWRTIGTINPNVKRETFKIYSGSDNIVQYTRVGCIDFELEIKQKKEQLTLNIYWLGGYGSGLLLPFGDKTNGKETYSGGRYLYDTIKGVDLGVEETKIVLDFNYAYNPLNVYNSNQINPITPDENKLPIAIEGGEKMFDDIT